MLFTIVALVTAAPTTLSDDGCALVDGAVRCFDLTDHCVSRPPTDRFVEFDQVEGSGCGRRDDGTVSCWGKGAFSSPPALAGVKQLSLSKTHACVIQRDDTLTCWGTDFEGSLAVPLGAFKQVSVGHSVSCALRDTGALSCWGWNAKTKLKPPTGAFVAVSAGLQAACALDEKQRLSCWGGVVKAPKGAFTSVAVGQFSATALTTDGGAITFGANGIATAVGPPMTRFLEVRPSCGRLASGELACWSPRNPTALQVDDGKTQLAGLDGACPKVAAAPAPVQRKRPWVDHVLGQLRAGTLDVEGARDAVTPGDLPHLAAAYSTLTTWRQKTDLVFLVQDSHDAVLRPLMIDVLSAPESTLNALEVWAVALSFLDGDFDRFTAYLNDPGLTKKTRAKRLAERKAP